jgi:transcriptional regulator GlxA family with amidase domain
VITLSPGATTAAAMRHLHDLASLHRVRDRINREYVQPLDLEALACGAHMSARRVELVRCVEVLRNG